jgi:L-rhamnose isomerase
MNTENEHHYRRAKDMYAEYNVDVENAVKTLSSISISLQCWQGDDVGGFENPKSELTCGGIQATGNYPGKARNIDELRSDLEKALGLIPGNHRLNLHAIYLENEGKKVDRNEINTKHFLGWIDWAKDHCTGLDFNPTFFSHPKAESGFTLANKDEAIRKFWIEHGIASRIIAADIGKALNSKCINNIWIPDGFKDFPADRKSPRERLANSLDQIFKQDFPKEYLADSVESKLFGIGSESYVVGSHEFYLGYAVKNKKMLCLDSGHFHPTEQIHDKISSILLYLDELILHVSRGVRWDSDHVVVLNDDIQSIAEELVRGDFLERVHIGLDYFDASINRVAAWVIGARNMLKAILAALLQPVTLLKKYESDGDYTSRLVIMEEMKTMPIEAIWNHHCLVHDVPIGKDWINIVKNYETSVLAKR